MTFRSVKLLRLLKRAQIREDNTLVIDFDSMKAWTLVYNPDSQPVKEVKLDRFCGSIIATLDHLKKLGYIDYDYQSGQAHVTHSGWNATSMTVKSAIQLTVKDIIVPVLVSIAATILLRYI